MKKKTLIIIIVISLILIGVASFLLFINPSTKIEGTPSEEAIMQTEYGEAYEDEDEVDANAPEMPHVTIGDDGRAEYIRPDAEDASIERPSVPGTLEDDPNVNPKPYPVSPDAPEDGDVIGSISLEDN